MKNKKLKLFLFPQHINDYNWYYEMPRNIIFVHEVRDLITNEYIRTDQIKIPWYKIRKSLERLSL